MQLLTVVIICVHFPLQIPGEYNLQQVSKSELCVFLFRNSLKKKHITEKKEKCINLIFKALICIIS